MYIFTNWHSAKLLPVDHKRLLLQVLPFVEQIGDRSFKFVAHSSYNPHSVKPKRHALPSGGSARGPLPTELDWRQDNQVLLLATAQGAEHGATVHQYRVTDRITGRAALASGCHRRRNAGRCYTRRRAPPTGPGCPWPRLLAWWTSLEMSLSTHTQTDHRGLRPTPP